MVVKGTLPARRTIEPRAIRRDLEVREVPARFAPPDALTDPTEALGHRPLALIPPGAYLTASHLRAPTPAGPEQRPLAGNLNPVEITVTGGRLELDQAHPLGGHAHPRAAATAGTPPLPSIAPRRCA